MKRREAEEREKATAQAAEAAAARFALVEVSSWRQRPPRSSLPKLPDDEEPLQCNEGDWEFSLEEERENDGSKVVVLQVELEKHLDVTTMQLDVRPRVVRLLARGRLLQLRLPSEVQCDRAVAQRSKASGLLRVVMPVDDGVVGGPCGSRVRRTAAKTSSKAVVVKTPCQRATTSTALLYGDELLGPRSSASVALADVEDERSSDEDNDAALPPLP